MTWAPLKFSVEGPPSNDLCSVRKHKPDKTGALTGPLQRSLHHLWEAQICEWKAPWPWNLILAKSFSSLPHLYIQTRKATHCDPVHSIITRSADMTPRFIILGSIVIQTQRYQTRQPRIVIQICPMFYTYEHNQGLKSLFKKIGKCLDLKQKA